MTLPVIFGVAGPELAADEHALFAETRPFGFILFARNLESPAQIAGLVDALRDAAGSGVPVLIDQEGGRVQRLGPPHAPTYPALAEFGRLAARNPAAAVKAAEIGHGLIGRDLAALGVDVDCAPVLDLAVKGADAVIGDRAFAADPEVVARLGQAAIDGLGRAGVLPVVKHMPGHGRAGADSHRELPVVDAPAALLDATDFAPFRALRTAPIAMTAHVVYTACDPDHPLTVSRRGIEDTVRRRIGFEGLLLSDDIGMGALAGPVEDRAARALAAGCDVALHCNGVFSEMARIAHTVPPLTDRAAARWDAAVVWRDAHRSPSWTADLTWIALRALLSDA